MHPKDHFSSVSGHYAQFRPHYPAALFRWLAEQVPATQLAWDCACGSGQASVDLARYFDRIEATDLSAQQLAEATPHPKVHYRVAVAEDSQLPAGAFDLITVAQALHWFECERFYAEARRVLKAGGVLAAWSYAVCVIEPEAADPIFQDFYAHTVGPYWPPERRHVESGYQTLPFPEPELIAPPLTMELQWSLDQLMGYVGSWSASSRYGKALGRDPVPALRAALLPHWGAAEARHWIRWPLHVRAAILNPR